MNTRTAKGSIRQPAKDLRAKLAENHLTVADLLPLMEGVSAVRLTNLLRGSVQMSRSMAECIEAAIAAKQAGP